ncbi:MAG: pentapeptide repeat-containing protein, partial [Candidatus Promineifilaceae bacterium]|nr:pentapeptide repeat-containing protein [Candidatus Promineifilaceae bacterium]
MARQVESGKHDTKRVAFIQGSWIFIGILAIIILGLFLFWALRPEQFQTWSGFGTAADEGLKTLWDWLGLLLLPLTLIGLTWWWQRTAKEIAKEKAMAGLVQDSIESFVSRMTDLMMDRGLLESQEGDEIRVIARALTSTTLRRVDGAGKGVIVEYLHKSGLLDVHDPIVDLSGLQLNGTDLEGYKLIGASLQRADMRHSILRDVDLSTADLRACGLAYSDMEHANLRESYIREADLRQVRL